MGEYLTPVILGGDLTIYAGNLIGQQFLTARDWPFGAAIAMVVIAAMTVLVLVVRAAGREAGRVRGARRALGAWAFLVYVFLYAPIGIVVLYAFNSGRQVLNWEGFSTKWFGEALSDPSITEPFRNSLVIAGGNAADRVRAGDRSRAGAPANAAVRAGAARRARVHDARHAGDRVRDLGADLLRRRPETGSASARCSA